MSSKNILTTTLFMLAFLSASSTLSAQARYKGAVGLRTGYYGNLGIDGKLFINDKAALEVIATTRSYGSNYYYGYSYRYNEIMALYQIHAPFKLIDNDDGFNWYYGGGASVGFYSDDVASNTLSIAGVIGVEYTLPKTPLTFSVDWMPRYFLSRNVYWSGFASNSGGFRIAYYFGGKN